MMWLVEGLGAGAKDGFNGAGVEKAVNPEFEGELVGVEGLGDGVNGVINDGVGVSVANHERGHDKAVFDHFLEEEGTEELGGFLVLVAGREDEIAGFAEEFKVAVQLEVSDDLMNARD